MGVCLPSLPRPRLGRLVSGDVLMRWFAYYFRTFLHGLTAKLRHVMGSDGDGASAGGCKRTNHALGPFALPRPAGSPGRPPRREAYHGTCPDRVQRYRCTLIVECVVARPRKQTPRCDPALAANDATVVTTAFAPSIHESSSDVRDRSQDRHAANSQRPKGAKKKPSAGGAGACKGLDAWGLNPSPTLSLLLCDRRRQSPKTADAPISSGQSGVKHWLRTFRVVLVAYRFPYPGPPI